MPKFSQISFRIDQDTREAFKAKLVAEGSDMSKVLNRLVRQFIAGSATTELQTTVSDENGSSLLDRPQNLHRLDTLERSVLSMLDTAGLANQIALLEIRLTAAIKVLEHQMLSSSRPHEGSEAQKLYFQSILTAISNVETQLAAIEKELANDAEKRQQTHTSDDEQVVAKLLANIKAAVAEQIAQQSVPLSEIAQKITDQQVEHQAQLAQVEARIATQIEAYQAQVARLIPKMSSAQQQKDSAPTDSPTSAASSQANQATGKSQGNKASSPQVGKITAESDKTVATESAPSAQQGKKTKDKQEEGQSSASPPLTNNGYALTDDGYVVINGVRKKLLLPNEAHEVAKKHGFKKDSKAFGKLSPSPLDPKVYRPYGLGIIPELRGTSGSRKAWYYEL